MIPYPGWAPELSERRPAISDADWISLGLPEDDEEYYARFEELSRRAGNRRTQGAVEGWIEVVARAAGLAIGLEAVLDE